MLVLVGMSDSQSRFDHFVVAAMRGPFRAAAREFRDAVRAEEENGDGDQDRLATPSAEMAERRATETMERSRSRFARVVEETGTADQWRLWSQLSADSRDEFVARLFAPPILGGFFGEESPSAKRQDVNVESDSEISSFGCNDESDDDNSEK